jgi:sulfonate transport system ATP-binding protein
MTTSAQELTAPTTAPGAAKDYAAGKATVELRGVTKGFGHEDDYEEVVHDLTLTIKPGELTALVGPSGCGKSTIVNLVAGYERPDKGEILIDGHKVTGAAQDRMVVFQETALFPWLTTRQNITFGPRLRGDMTAQEIESEADRLLARVGLNEFKDKYPSQLSGGMQRRAELARSMINKPKVMILDEPFRGLDAMTKRLMQEYYANLYDEFRRTTFFVTTDIDEAIYLADRILIMTNIPTQVRAVIDVNLPRPRQVENVTESDEANAIKMQALGLLHEEAMKSFARGSKAAADFIDAYSKRVSKS